jgi:hypothetical protein
VTLGAKELYRLTNYPAASGHVSHLTIGVSPRKGKHEHPEILAEIVEKGRDEV